MLLDFKINTTCQGGLSGLGLWRCRLVSTLVVALWLALILLLARNVMLAERNIMVKEGLEKARFASDMLSSFCMVAGEAERVHGGNPDFRALQHIDKINPLDMTREILAKRGGGQRVELSFLSDTALAGKTEDWGNLLRQGQEEGWALTPGWRSYRFEYARLVTGQDSCLFCHENIFFKADDRKGVVRVSLQLDPGRVREPVWGILLVGTAGVLLFWYTGVLWRRFSGSKDRYRFILDQVHDGVYLIDACTFRFCFINRSGLQQIGYGQGELQRLSPADLCPEFTPEQIQDMCAPLVSGEQDILWFETVLLARQGRLIPVEVNLQYFSNNNERYFLSVVRDITEKRKDMVEKEELQKQLFEAQRLESIATLAGGITHDFNNILTSIMGYTDLAIYQLGKDHKVAEDLRLIQEAGNRARDLVQQILTFSRQRSGTKKKIWIQPLTKEVVKMIKATMPSSIRIRQEICQQGWKISADPSQMHQLLMNLCINAMHAMEEQGGTLTVRVQEVVVDDEENRTPCPGGKYLKLQVSDTGTGIHPEHLSRIFEPYFTTKEKEKGTGLGLAVVHGIVRAHGAYIDVESSPGKGTTFSVYLPAVEDTDTQVRKGDESFDRLSIRENLHGQRIFVVDDQLDLVQLVVRILEEYGCDVRGFTSAKEFLSVFGQDPSAVDLLLVDLDMPEMNGVQVLEKARRIRVDIPVVLCSGFEDKLEQVTVRAKEKFSAPDAVVHKPVAGEELVLVLSRILSR